MGFKWSCDKCGEIIEDSKQASILEVVKPSFHYHIPAGRFMLCPSCWTKMDTGWMKLRKSIWDDERELRRSVVPAAKRRSWWRKSS